MNLKRILFALFLSIPLVLTAEPNLSGKWTLNKKESDDPRKKFEESHGSSSSGEHHHGGWGGQHSGGGMGQGHGGGGYGGGGHDHGGDRMKALEELTVDFKAPEFKVTDKDGTVRTYYTDGRETEIDESRGRLRKATAKFENDQIVVTSATQDGSDSTETYYLSPDSNRLYVKVRMKSPMMDEPITFVRVYDRNPPPKEN